MLTDVGIFVRLLPSPARQQSTNIREKEKTLKRDRCKEGKMVGINKQTSVRKEGQSRGWKCEDGRECVFMLTGP